MGKKVTGAQLKVHTLAKKRKACSPSLRRTHQTKGHGCLKMQRRERPLLRSQGATGLEWPLMATLGPSSI